jgi:putative endonuclease
MFDFIRKLWGPKQADNSGIRGEKLAAEWLESVRGFKVVARNWRRPAAKREEIDLICRDVEVLVFVEVKARTAGALVAGFNAVNRRKKRALRRVIKGYLIQLRERPTTFRFDVVEVTLPACGSRDAPEVLHFENVPLFSKYFRAGD